MEILKRIKKDWVFLVIVLLLIVVRVVYLAAFHPPLTWIDASQYDELAWNTLTQHVYSQNDGVPFAGREPGYPLLFLLPIYFLFGHNILAIQVAQLFLSIGIAILLFSLGQKYFNKVVALLAVLIFALYPAFIAYTGEALTEIFFTFLILLFVFTLLRAIEKRSIWLFALGGLIIGSAALTRSIALFLPVFLFPFLWWFLRDWQKSLKYSLLMLIIVVAMMVPWVWRSYKMYNLVIFGRMGAGEIFWSASYIPWEGEWKGGDALPYRDLIKGKSALEQELMFRKMFKEEVKADPLGVLKIWLKKPAKMFLKSEFNSILEKENSFANFFKKSPWLTADLVKAGLWLINILILGLSAVGILSLLKSNALAPSLFIYILFYFFVFYLPVHPDSRYKLPLLPYIMTFSSVGILALLGFFKKLFLKPKKA
jgi:4-amino-4-deoxy-L-arabinose transferase-like glycosyltransferase